MASGTFDYLIIGNSAGGVGCIEGIRRQDKKGRIAVVSDEPHHVYSRPLITHLLDGHLSGNSMDFRPRDFYRKTRVDFFPGFRAASLDADGREVHAVPVAGGPGKVLRFKKLLIATGARPFMPLMEGLGLEGITPMITLDQSLRVREDLGQVRKAVVLGAGLIGTKTAQALAGRLEEVTLVELGDRILAPVTDPVSSGMAMEAFRKGNVEIILNNTVTAAGGDSRGRIAEVTLKDGTSIPCQLLVLAAGVRPKAELAAGAGVRIADVKTGGGIDVNTRMETNRKGIYACGDCAHAWDFVTGGMRLLPLWPNAYIGGRVAGLNMTGSEYRHTWVTNMNSVDFFGLPMVSAGFVLKPEEPGFEEIVREDEGAYAKVILKDDIIRGLIMAGNVQRAGLYLGLMRSEVRTTPFRDQLLRDEFSAADLGPEGREEIMRPIMEMES
ncbi:MAG: FAD-dependent oxidoreductase [Proteobacteria bacterium]|nr:FAD-dependent oxidoreductase [Pseudomonadota bacterium]